MKGKTEFANEFECFVNLNSGSVAERISKFMQFCFLENC
jgi:hypothetical protein